MHKVPSGSGDFDGRRNVAERDDAKIEPQRRSEVPGDQADADRRRARKSKRRAETSIFIDEAIVPAA